jgi:hypothetical protein
LRVKQADHPIGDDTDLGISASLKILSETALHYLRAELTILVPLLYLERED